MYLLDGNGAETRVSAPIFEVMMWNNPTEGTPFIIDGNAMFFHIMIGNHLTEKSIFEVDVLGTRMVCTRYPYQFPIKASISKATNSELGVYMWVHKGHQNPCFNAK